MKKLKEHHPVSLFKSIEMLNKSQVNPLNF
jgi:hypothetical protein